MSGKPCEWEIGVDDDPVERALTHISSDSYFTLKILKVDSGWLQRAADGSISTDDLEPGLSKYIRLTNDTAERMIKNAEDTAHDGTSVESAIYACISE